MQSPMEKSSASIVTSTEDGILISWILSASFESEVSFRRSFSVLVLTVLRLSSRPGKPMPTTTVFLPSLITFPLSTVTFFTFSPLKTMPVTAVKGTYTSPTFSLLVYSILIFTLPFLPAISSGETSFPSRK